MKKITFFNSKMLFKLIAFLGVFLCTGLLSESQAQIAYTQDFSTTTHGWSSTEFSHTTTTVCATTGSLRRNLYSSATTGITASPTIGASNGGLVTLSYQYKVIDWSGGAATPNNFGSFKVQYSTDNTTWFDVPGSTVSTDHVPSTTCATKTLNFSIAPSTATYVRFNATWSAGDYYLYFDEVAISQGAAPSCATPSGFASSAITSNAATISWNATATAPATGYEYFYSNVNTGPSGAGTPTTALTANLTALTPNTLYYVWLRSDCGTAQSTWNGPFTFKTSCVAFAVPFTEGFNAASTTQGCWTVLNVNNDTDSWNMDYATTPIEGDQSAMLYTDGNAGANNDYLISPKITLNGNQRLVFKYKVQSSFEPNDFAVLLSTTGNAAADFTTTLSPLTSYSNTAVETKVISLSGTSGDVYIAWHVPAGGLDGWRLYIDDVVVEDIPAIPPTCSTITSPTTGAQNVSNTTVTWTTSLDATGYYVSAGYSSGTTEVLNLQNVGNVTSYIIPTDPATTYYVKVIPFNSFGQATGCSEISFTTCDEIGNFSENFDALTATGQLPTCWSRVFSGTLGSPTVGASTVNNSAPYSIALANSSSTASANIMLVTPYLNNLGSGTNRLKFFARNTVATQDIEVGTMTNPADPSTFTVLQSVDLSTTFQQFSVSFAAYTGTNKYIAIRRLSTSTFSTVYIDNVVWEAIPTTPPTCSTITSPTTGAQNVINSTITWASNADATGYKISVGTSSGTTNILNLQDVGNVFSYTFPADPGTTYYVTVFPYNTFGQASGCTEVSFTTCDGITPPHLETFGTFLPGCWQAADNGNLTTGPATFGTSSWTADGFGNVGTTGAIRYEIWLASANDWVISPLVSIPATGYELKFDAAATQWNTTAAPTTPWEADDFVQVLISTTGTTNWTVLYTYDNTNVPAPTGTANVIDLDAYAGMDVRFAFRVVEGTADGGADLNFYVDNFEIRLTPAAPPTCAANVVATPNATCGNFPNTISWAATSGANGYRITIGTTSGGTTIANNIDLGNTLSYSFTGLLNTTYFYTLVPYNTAGAATGCTEMSFITNANGCYCTSAPTSVDGNGITNVQIGTTNFPSTVATAPFYNNFTATPVNLSQGISNNVQISYDTGFGYTYNYAIFIDANDDYILDASEIVATGSVSNTPAIQTVNASFVLPGTIPLGSHRMRIVTADSAFDLPNSFNPCYSGTYGETLDFTVNIVAAPSCLPPTALNVTNITTTTASLGWTAGGTETSWDIEWGTFGFTPTGTPTINGATNPQSVTTLSPNTTYSYYVRSNCGTNSVSTWSGPFSFTTTCTADAIPYSQNFESTTSTNLPSCTVQQNVGTGNLWTVQNNPGYGFTTKALRYAYHSTNDANVWFFTNGVNLVAGTNYKISYDYGSASSFYVEKLKVSYGTAATAAGMTTLLADHPNVVNNVAPINNFVNFTPTTSGVYYFGFHAYSVANQFNLYVDNILVDLALSSGSFDNNSFVAYPNPVKDIFNVSYSSEISSVRVMNLLGQEVITREVNATSTQIDMSQLSSGAYIVNVTVGDTIKTIKVVKQ